MANMNMSKKDLVELANNLEKKLKEMNTIVYKMENEISELNVEIGQEIGKYNKLKKELIEAKSQIKELKAQLNNNEDALTEEDMVNVLNNEAEKSAIELQEESLKELAMKQKKQEESTKQKKQATSIDFNAVIGVSNNELQDDEDEYGEYVEAEEVEAEEETKAAKETMNKTIKEAVKEAVQDNTCTMNEEELGYFQKTVESIVKFSTHSINGILNADYNEVPDMLVNTAREAIQKFVSKGKGVDVTSNIAAFGKVRTFIDNMRNTIEVDLNEDPTALQRFGAFIKAIIVKALKVLLATGKIVGKAAIVIGTLITKVVVFTVTETIEAGVAILTIAKNEYNDAILG